MGRDKPSVDPALADRVLAQEDSGPKGSRPFKQRTAAMGQPRVDLDKALALAARLEDEELVRKLRRSWRGRSAAPRRR